MSSHPPSLFSIEWCRSSPRVFHHDGGFCFSFGPCRGSEIKSLTCGFGRSFKGSRRRRILTVRCRSSGTLPVPISQSQILLDFSKIRMYDVCLFFVLRPCLPSACTGFTNYYPCYHAEQIALVLCCILARRGNNLSVLIECCNRYCTSHNEARLFANAQLSISCASVQYRLQHSMSTVQHTGEIESVHLDRSGRRAIAGFA